MSEERWLVDGHHYGWVNIHRLVRETEHMMIIAQTGRRTERRMAKHDMMAVAATEDEAKALADAFEKAVAAAKPELERLREQLSAAESRRLQSMRSAIGQTVLAE